jgi:tetratricopeptide (TPR) repeat protein
MPKKINPGMSKKKNNLCANYIPIRRPIKMKLQLAVAFLVMIVLTGFAAAQNAGQAPSQPGQPQAAAPAPSGRPPIQTKTPAEYQAYQSAIANSKDPAAMEKAADDFAAKFPESEVRVLLYRASMASYQSAGNSKKMLDLGLKVLSIDKDDPEALIGVAQVLEEQTSPTDLDREQRENQALDAAGHALKTIDTDLAVPAGTPPEKVEGYKKYLRSTALAITGTIYYKQGKYSDAEGKLRDAVDADSSNPDPVIILRLALSLDQQKKYADALQQANRAVDLTQESTDVGKMARDERDRLVIQTKTTAPAAPQNPAPPQSSGPPSH